MVVGTIKSYILHEDKVGEYGIRVLKLDSSDSVELEIKADGKTIVRKKMDSIEDAKKFIDNIIQKTHKNKDKKPNKRFNLKDTKEARINSEFPKAFKEDSPSNGGNPFSPDGPGGLLHHMEALDDKKKKPFNKRRRNRTRSRDKWDETGGKEDNNFQLSKWGPENGPSRDSGPDRPGFDNALGKERDGFRPPLPTDEDAIERQRHPERFAPSNYSALGVQDIKDEQALADDERKNVERRKQRNVQDADSKDQYVVIINDKGKRKKFVGLTFQDATERSRKYPGSKIVKQK